jgi:hypothetical protein
MKSSEQEILVQSLVSRQIKIRESNSQVQLVLISSSQSLESINQDLTAGQGEVNLQDLIINYTDNPLFINQLMVQVRAYKREHFLYNHTNYSDSNKIQIKVWSSGFIVIQLAGQEINIWNYASEPGELPYLTIELSGLNVPQMLKKIKDPMLLNKNWNTFGTYRFRGINPDANSAALAYEILKAGGIDKILEFSCYEVDIDNITIYTLANILFIAKQTEEEDRSIPNIQPSEEFQSKIDMNDALYDIILLTAINSNLIKKPSLSQMQWELTESDEQLQAILNTYDKKPQASEMKMWFKDRYNLKENDTREQKYYKLNRRKTLLDLSDSFKQFSDQGVQRPLQASKAKLLKSHGQNIKPKNCLIM